MLINIFILLFIGILLGYCIACFVSILERSCCDICCGRRDLLVEELEREMIEVVIQHNKLLYEIENFSFDKKKDVVVFINPDNTISIGV